MSENNQKSRTAYTSVNSMFDNFHSAMTVGLVESSMYVELRPIFDNMIGKEPEKGKPMYDGDNSIFFRLQPQQVLLLSKQLELFVAGEIEECEIQAGDRILNISNSESFEDANYHVLSISQPESEGSEDMVTLQFNFAEPTDTLLGVSYEGDEAVTRTESMSIDWEWFVKFVLEGALLNSFNLSLHAGNIASKYIGTAAGGSRTSRSSSAATTSGRTRGRRTASSNTDAKTTRATESKKSSADSAVNDILDDLGDDIP